MKKIIFLLMIPLLFSCQKKTSLLPSQLKPGTAEYYLNQGIFYLNEGKINQAESRLLKALAKKPALKQAHYSLGIVYTYKLDFPRSEKHLKKVLALDPGFFDAYNFLGLVYTEMKKFDLAKEYLLKAANAQKYRTPENAYVNLALLEIKQKNYSSAMRYVDLGLKANKNFSPLYNLKGIILENQNKLEAALLHYNRALDFITAEDVDILINIGRTKWKLGDRNGALDTLEKAMGLSRTPRKTDQIRRLIKEING